MVKDEEGDCVCTECFTQSQELGIEERADLDNLGLGTIATNRTRSKGPTRKRTERVDQSEDRHKHLPREPIDRRSDPGSFNADNGMLRVANLDSQISAEGILPAKRKRTPTSRYVAAAATSAQSARGVPTGKRKSGKKKETRASRRGRAIAAIRADLPVDEDNFLTQTLYAHRDVPGARRFQLRLAVGANGSAATNLTDVAWRNLNRELRLLEREPEPEHGATTALCAWYTVTVTTARTARQRQLQKEAELRAAPPHVSQDGRCDIVDRVKNAMRECWLNQVIGISIGGSCRDFQ
eukprot:SAG11_NODE_1812_length_4220_cov_3.629944_3_plen_295_part_00